MFIVLKARRKGPLPEVKRKKGPLGDPYQFSNCSVCKKQCILHFITAHQYQREEAKVSYCRARKTESNSFLESVYPL